MILILGSGYAGMAFRRECRARGVKYEGISRNDFNYHDYKLLRGYVEQLKPELIVNCAAYIPVRSVDDCKLNRPETLKANVMLPCSLVGVCEATDTALAHISTACLYDDAREYSETDLPTRNLKDGYCSFYLRTKYLSEQLVETYPKAYVWRIRLPFDEISHPKNYLTKLKSFPQVWNHTNSLSHRADYVKAALDLWQMRANFGVYNMCNRGTIAARAICAMAGLEGKEFVDGPVTGSTLSTAKLEATGCGMRSVEEAVRESLMGWKEA